MKKLILIPFIIVFSTNTSASDNITSNDLFNLLDVNADGQLSVQEFQRMPPQAMQKRIQAQENMQRAEFSAFEKFDDALEEGDYSPEEWLSEH